MKTNKNDLINKAANLNFVSEMFYNKQYKYSNKEDLRWYLWMCELQKWLENKHNIFIEILVDQTMEPKFCYNIIKHKRKTYEWKNRLKDSFLYLYYTKEEALYEALNNGLYLINDKQ